MAEIIKHPFYLSRPPRPMKVPVVPPPTLEEVEKPVKTADDIDPDIFRNLKILWHGVTEEELIESLTNDTWVLPSLRLLSVVLTESLAAKLGRKLYTISSYDIVPNSWRTTTWTPMTPLLALLNLKDVYRRKLLLHPPSLWSSLPNGLPLLQSQRGGPLQKIGSFPLHQPPTMSLSILFARMLRLLVAQQTNTVRTSHHLLQHLSLRRREPERLRPKRHLPLSRIVIRLLQSPRSLFKVQLLFDLRATVGYLLHPHPLVPMVLGLSLPRSFLLRRSKHLKYPMRPCSPSSSRLLSKSTRCLFDSL